jgi:starch synthase
LGEGDPEYETLFRGLAEALPGRVAVRIGYDNAQAHRILAGADMFLMPSRYEPCGMTQMFSLRYGAVPVVRSTGGLDDTIEVGTGFKFAEYSGAALLGAIRDAVGMFSDSGAWRETMLRGMAKDFSWATAAGAYSALYRRLLGVNP